MLRFYNATFPDSLKRTFEGKEILKKLSGRINTKKGGEAPDFMAKDITGKTIALSKLHGKYVLLDFWASWCVPCMHEMPEIKSIREKYSPEKLALISISLDDNYNEFKAAIAKIKPTWTEIYITNRDLINRYAIGPIPQLYLIDRNGYVIYNKEEEKDYDLTKLKQLLSQIIGK
ncbi:TlpA family protein disulfide reductase [Microbacter margulisiae]|uniref:Thiol-disulfide isomerase/thioredoxin n=1 Tax=Microbacter margulisiae TaxID=1350067 RepID=A0A7W5DQW7_9PORP|nr:TlpA disulfide reductase family protein [Microbacter margulisiae]MBB3187080.1 thiol-disulfide isomerase/thioredoxin [Microbacter margulisiae]